MDMPCCWGPPAFLMQTHLAALQQEALRCIHDALCSTSANHTSDLFHTPVHDCTMLSNPICFSRKDTAPCLACSFGHSKSDDKSEAMSSAMPSIYKQLLPLTAQLNTVLKCPPGFDVARHAVAAPRYRREPASAQHYAGPRRCCSGAAMTQTRTTAASAVSAGS